MRIESIYIRCLASGRTGLECTKSKEAEARVIANEALEQELEKEKERTLRRKGIASKELKECIGRVSRNAKKKIVIPGTALLELNACTAKLRRL